MWQAVNVVKARSNFADLLGQVYYGGRKFLIRKLGKPVAVLIGIEEYRRLCKARDYFFAKIKEQQKKNQKIPFSQVEKDIEEAISSVRE